MSETVKYTCPNCGDTQIRHAGRIYTADVPVCCNNLAMASTVIKPENYAAVGAEIASQVRTNKKKLSLKEFVREFQLLSDNESLPFAYDESEVTIIIAAIEAYEGYLSDGGVFDESQGPEQWCISQGVMVLFSVASPHVTIVDPDMVRITEDGEIEFENVISEASTLAEAVEKMNGNEDE